MDGLSLRITIHCRRMTGLTREVHWTSTMQHGIRRWQRLLSLDELIHKHSTIMDKYDPEKKIGLICDEWGDLV